MVVVVAMATVVVVTVAMAVAMAVVAVAVTAPEENEIQRGETRVAGQRERDGTNESWEGEREWRKSEQRGSYVRCTSVEGV